MKSIDNIIKFQNLQADIWGYTTNLLSILQWFDGEDATDKAITSGLLVNDAKDRFTMWCDLVNEHYKIWTEWISTIDLDSVDRELYDDCPDNATLTNRLRIVKLRAGDMWNKNEYDSQFHKVLYSFDRLKALILATYEIEEDDADKMAGQIKQRLTLRLINVMQMQMIVQSIISKGENLLNPQPEHSNDTTEQKKTVKSHTSILDDEEIKEVFNAFVEKGYMVKVGNYYHWNKSSHLLAYFCEKVSLYFLNSTKTYEGKDAVEWKKFEDLFEIEIRGKVEHPDNERLRAYKNNWYRGKDRKAIEFLPDGYNDVEDILADLH